MSFSHISFQNGIYNVALEEFESILSDLLSKYGERHERVGAALHNVAIANLRAGSLDDAMDAIEEAIKIRSRALGRTHPKVAVRTLIAGQPNDSSTERISPTLVSGFVGRTRYHSSLDGRAR